MSKRKQPLEHDAEDSDASRADDVAPQKRARTSMRTTRALAKLEHGERVVQKALKLAAGFERQKFSRRKKNAGEKNDSSAQSRLDAENVALKTMDFNSVARNHLYKSLLKIKAVAKSPFKPDKLVLPPKGPSPDLPVLNVTARLYKSNAVRKALEEVVSDILHALGVGNKSNDKATKSANVERAQPEELPFASFSDEDEDEGEDSLGQELEPSDIESEGSFDSDAETAKLKKRKASGASGPSPPDDLESADNSLEDEELEQDIARARKTAPQKAEGGRAGESAFLPTLSMGGYWSGSESEPESDIDVAPKKNRRGQRARQQIAEKKYGQKAKHLQNQSKNDRNKGWDPKKGAQPDGGDRRGAPRGRGPMRSGPNSEMVKPRGGAGMNAPAKKDNEGPVHPSWEAAKKAKEASQTAAFTGKKITFD